MVDIFAPFHAVWLDLPFCKISSFSIYLLTQQRVLIHLHVRVSVRLHEYIHMLHTMWTQPIWLATAWLHKNIKTQTTGWWNWQRWWWCSFLTRWLASNRWMQCLSSFFGVSRNIFYNSNQYTIYIIQSRTKLYIP